MVRWRQAVLSATVGAVALVLAPLVTSVRATDSDPREEIVLDASERATLLNGMRIYLESVHDIVAALAESQVQRAEASARKSGAKMLQDVSPLTALKLPIGFMSISLDTHDKFDRLAERIAHSASRTDVLGDLRDILANCTSCHLTYRMAPTQ